MAIAVKICGLNDPQSLDQAISKGACYVGFVFYPKSPRAITPAQGRILAKMVPSSIKRVGVVVDADDDFLNDLLSNVPIDMLQCHGLESKDRLSEIRRRFHVPILKAIGVTGVSDIEGAAAFQDVVDMILFDSKPSPMDTRPGGNATSFRWSLLQSYVYRRPWMLAGGLHIDNLAEAVRASGAKAVDVSSGIEDRPGHKDLEKIADFLNRAMVL